MIGGMKFRDNLTRKVQLAGYGMIPPLSITSFVHFLINRVPILMSKKKNWFSASFRLSTRGLHSSYSCWSLCGWADSFQRLWMLKVWSFMHWYCDSKYVMEDYIVFDNKMNKKSIELNYSRKERLTSASKFQPYRETPFSPNRLFTPQLNYQREPSSVKIRTRKIASRQI